MIENVVITWRNDANCTLSSDKYEGIWWVMLPCKNKNSSSEGTRKIIFYKFSRLLRKEGIFNIKGRINLPLEI